MAWKKSALKHSQTFKLFAQCSRAKSNCAKFDMLLTDGQHKISAEWLDLCIGRKRANPNPLMAIWLGKSPR
jgi:hypothetical protein